MKILEWGEATGIGENQCTGVWQGYANFKDWKKFEYYGSGGGWIQDVEPQGTVGGDPQNEPDPIPHRNPSGCSSVTGGTDWGIGGLVLNQGTTTNITSGSLGTTRAAVAARAVRGFRS